MTLKRGDIFYTEGNDYSKENEPAVYKLFKVLGLNFGTLHILGYEYLDKEPTLDDLHGLAVRIYHMPFEAQAFGNDYVLLGNQPVEERELLGYLIYKKPSVLNLSKEELDEELKAFKKSED